MREVGVYSVGCSSYGYLVISHSHNMKISREIEINRKADNHRHKHKTKNRSRHKHNCNRQRKDDLCRVIYLKYRRGRINPARTRASRYNNTKNRLHKVTSFLAVCKNSTKFCSTEFELSMWNSRYPYSIVHSKPSVLISWHSNLIISNAAYVVNHVQTSTFLSLIADECYALEMSDWYDQEMQQEENEILKPVDMKNRMNSRERRLDVQSAVGEHRINRNNFKWTQPPGEKFGGPLGVGWQRQAFWL